MSYYNSNVKNGGNSGFSILGNLSQKLASFKVKENLSLPCSLSFRSFIHSGDPKKVKRWSISRPWTLLEEVLGKVEMADFEDPNLHNMELRRMLTSCI
ncbi:hypothetical protein ACH5RR_029703 [Cinchona calisaya]|uniref:Uncharacterized protein n=1 Tax=Cinchona calisaya TaxID=153742 RepID=A0ABD2YWT3_9GENT